MAVIKNQKTGMWEVRTYYKDWSGTRRQKTKGGFAKKSEAQEFMELTVLSTNSTPPFPMYEFTSFLSVLVPNTAHISKFSMRRFWYFCQK